MTQQQVKIWHENDNGYCKDDELIERYDGYKKRRVQKAKNNGRVSHAGRIGVFLKRRKKRHKSCGSNI